MHIGNFIFKPRLIPTLATLVMVPFLVSLGIWQLNRAHQRQALLNAFERRTHEPPLPLDAALQHVHAVLYRQIIVTGRYDLKHQVLLDNQMHHDQPGFHVYTPLRLDSSHQAILVNRGWVPMGEGRDRLPAQPLRPPAGSIRVRGILVEPPQKGLLLGPVDNGPGWPKIIEAVELPRLDNQLGYRLLPYVILLDKDQKNGFVRDWRPFGAITPRVNLGYAMQWFTMALTVVIIYFVVNTRRADKRGNAP